MLPHEDWSKALISTVLITALGATLRGELVLLCTFIWKYISHLQQTRDGNATITDPLNSISRGDTMDPFKDFWFYWSISVFVSLATFNGAAGFFHWYFYKRQKDNPEKWKCQPDRWLSPSNERHEMIMGSINMFIGGSYSAVLVCYLFNGGKTALYFEMGKYGWLWEVLSLPMLFLVQDCGTYYAHKLYHTPLLYRHIHKWHHRYHSPTAFAAGAMHPLEFLTYQTVLEGPMFFLPCHVGTYFFCLLYYYYYGTIAHSGVKMTSIWPWQPASIYHDDHHKYFHCNFGFNTKLFDWLHGTIRRVDRLYTEETFGGQGVPKITQSNPGNDEKLHCD